MRVGSGEWGEESGEWVDKLNWAAPASQPTQLRLLNVLFF